MRINLTVQGKQFCILPCNTHFLLLQSLFIYYLNKTVYLIYHPVVVLHQVSKLITTFWIINSYKLIIFSFETQCSFFKQLIENDPKLEFVKVYADKGKSGLSADKRTGFQEMMHDARNGKFQLLLCKSISRFARNAIEAQHYVQELMELNIEVRFQKEKISTKDLSAEMTFNILSAAAQEESRSISEKVKWAYRKRAERGVCHLGNNRVLGMDEVDGKLKPNKDAWIIKRIFEEYAAGKSPTYISLRRIKLS